MSTYLEALINEIGIVGLGSKYYKENLDKLSVQAKWEVVLKLIYSKAINKESQEYESLNNIISLRNKLVHYKTKAIEKPTQETMDVEREYVVKILSTFELAMQNLKKIHEDLIDLDRSRNILKLFGFSKELKRI